MVLLTCLFRPRPSLCFDGRGNRSCFIVHVRSCKIHMAGLEAHVLRNKCCSQLLFDVVQEVIIYPRQQFNRLLWFNKRVSKLPAKYHAEDNWFAYFSVYRYTPSGLRDQQSFKKPLTVN